MSRLLQNVPVTQFMALVILTAGLVVGAKYYAKTQPQEAVARANPRAVIETTKGKITIELYERDAPRTVDNFMKLAQKGYYEGVIFHRVIKDFMIQTGDPTGTGTGGESAFGQEFADEINPRAINLSESLIRQYEKQGYKYRYDLKSHEIGVGTVAMANRGPNTNTSQFFIVTEKEQPSLNGRHTAFGKVVEGMDVVRAIAAVPVDTENNDKPLEDVKMTKVTIER